MRRLFGRWRHKYARRCITVIRAEGSILWSQGPITRITWLCIETSSLKIVRPRLTLHLTLVLIDHNNVIEVSDFGLAKVFTPVREKFMNSSVGTKRYMSLEVMNYRPYSFASDMYSIGCVLYELATLSPPFIGRTSYEIENQKMWARIPDLPTSMDTNLPLFSRELKGIIWYSCFCYASYFKGLFKSRAFSTADCIGRVDAQESVTLPYRWHSVNPQCC